MRIQSSSRTLKLVCFVVSLPLSAQTPACTPNNPECKHPQPRCIYVANNDYVWSMQRPQLASEIQPAIDKQLRLHRASYPTYSLPVTFLWDALGVAGLMQKASLSCCDPGITFTRIATHPAWASFERVGSSVTVHNTTSPTLQGYEITIDIPNTIRGYTVVSAGLTEFDFESGRGASQPRLKITRNNATETLFDSPIACFQASVTGVSVKRPQPSTRTEPNLIIQP